MGKPQICLVKIGKNTTIVTRLLMLLLAYVLLKFFGGSFGRLILYPVTLLVTFLHEFGHALAALLTGGQVVGLQVNWDGSGYTTTRGGSPALILIGGYLGSVLLGNTLLRIAVWNLRATQNALMTLAGVMLFAGIAWYESITSSLILAAFAAIIIFIALRTSWDRDVLLFFGIATVLYVLEDFRQGPGSDLAMFESRVGLFPAHIWMYLWLFLAVAITVYNLRPLWRRLL